MTTETLLTIIAVILMGGTFVLFAAIMELVNSLNRQNVILSALIQRQDKDK